MKPLRQRKHDRITYGGAPRDEMAVDHAIAPFDRRAREADATWGTDRLVALVAPETAARYGRTLASLNDAIAAHDAVRAADRASACIRGMDALDAEARSLGHEPPKSGVIVCDLDGWTFGVLPDPDLWRIAEAEHPGLRIYTIRELGVLARAAEQGHPGLADVKDAFPGAEIKRMRERLPAHDEIPF
jgi:hypothetical protein